MWSSSFSACTSFTFFLCGLLNFTNRFFSKIPFNISLSLRSNDPSFTFIVTLISLCGNITLGHLYYVSIGFAIKIEIWHVEVALWPWNLSFLQVWLFLFHNLRKLFKTNVILCLLCASIFCVDYLPLRNIYCLLFGIYCMLSELGLEVYSSEINF